jgi:hypothetical protein
LLAVLPNPVAAIVSSLALLGVRVGSIKTKKTDGANELMTQQHGA